MALKSRGGTCTADIVWNYNNTLGTSRTVSGGTLNLTNETTTDPDLQSDDTFLPTAPVIGAGTRWWTAPNPTGIGGEPFSDLDTDVGHIQSTYGPFHPKNL